MAVGLVIGVLGLAWLGQASVGTPYWTGVALPMVLIGVAQGLVLAPLTATAVADVTGTDAGAASGMVNVAHQLGGSLGLAVLVVVFSVADPTDFGGAAVLAHRLAAAIDTGALMLLAALGVTLATIHRKPATSECSMPASAPACRGSN